MEKQGLLIRACWRKCWEGMKTFKTIEDTKKYYGKARFIHAAMLVELLESIGNL